MTEALIGVCLHHLFSTTLSVMSKHPCNDLLLMTDLSEHYCSLKKLRQTLPQWLGTYWRANESASAPPARSAPAPGTCTGWRTLR